jgi:hypothetical protein
MNQVVEKLRLIYVPFLIVAVGVIGGYTFLNWFLVIDLHLISPKEDLINFWIPFGLPWIPELIWLRPRIKLLHLTGKNRNLPFLYQFIAVLAIAVPTIIAQFYIETAAGKLSALDNIEQIARQDMTKYYTLENFYIDKQDVGVERALVVSGKYGQYLNMNLYIALPIFAKQADVSHANCLAWYGIKYSEQISNRLSDAEKQTRLQQFATESQANFDEGDVNLFEYLDRIGNSDDRDNFIAAIKNCKGISGNSTIVLVPVYGAFESRNGNKLGWIFGTWGIGAFVWLIMVLIPKIDT